MHDSNQFLSAINSEDLQTLAPHLKFVQMKQGDVLYSENERIRSVYFPFDSIVSLVVTLRNGQTIDIAMVGRDGVVGATSALDGNIAINKAVIQIGGRGATCDPTRIKDLARKSSAFMSLVIRHEQAVYAQAQQSAACNIAHFIEARLSRWLLRARDLAGHDELPFTHEYLSDMLGVNRTSVSPAANILQQAGLIKYSRGKIQILDVEGLRSCACECYNTISKRYEFLLGKK